MRFQPSQTTPSFLDRRIQLRMLSFVGLISVVMVTLSVINTRQAPSDKTMLRQSASSADDLTFEVTDDASSLKPDEVYVVANNTDNGIRGQWNDQSVEDDVPVRDRGLFKPRRLERAEELDFFPRRLKSLPHRDHTSAPNENPLEDEPRPPSRSPFDDDSLIDLKDRTRENLPARSSDWEPTPTSPPREDDRAGVWDVLTKNLTDEADKESNLPDQPFEEPSTTPQPIESPRDEAPVSEPETIPARKPKHQPSRPVVDDFPESNPLRQPHRDETPVEKFKLNDDFTTDELPNVKGKDRSAPIDLRHRDDLWIQDRNVEPSRKTDPSRNDEPGRRRDLDEPRDFDDSRGGDVASPKIDKGYLDQVKDNTMGVRRDEAEVFYWLLDHARRVPSAKLDRAGLREVQYINLMTEPDRFRGELVTIEGDLWRLYEFDAGQNPYGVNRLYEAWVFTGDSANHPYRIVCTSLPKGIEPGENLRKPVKVTGYFFKREGYRSNGGVHVAPTLLARRMSINPTPNGIPSMAGIVPTMTGAVMAIGLALLITMVGFAIGDERARSGRDPFAQHQPRLSFSNLNLPAPVPVEESLRLFAERERQSAVSGAYGPLLSRQAAREHAVRDGQSFRQFERDTDLQRQQRSSDVVVDWANRQKLSQAQIDSLDPHGFTGPVADELDSDSLAPARTRIVKPIQPVSPPREAERPISGVPAARRFESTYGSPAAPVGSPSPAPSVAPRNESYTPANSNISYGASKLSEWEEEISRMNSRQAARAMAAPLPTVREISVAEQIEIDRVSRERETQEQIRRQQSELERRRIEQLDRDRIERERAELERLRHQQAVADQYEIERTSFDRSDRHASRDSSSSHSMTATERFESEELARRRSENQLREQERLIRDRIERERIEREQLQRERQEHERRLSEFEHRYRSDDVESQSDVDDELISERDLTDSAGDQDATPKPGKRRGGGWGWPRRRKNVEPADGTEQTPDVSSSGDAGDNDSTSTGWGRSRKRRRRWRDDGTT